MYVWAALILVIAASILLAVGTIWFVNRVLGHSAGREYNSTLSPFVTTVALVYGTLLGFTVVVAWEQFSSAEVNVANEASTLATMYRQTVAMPAAGQQQMRDLVRKYTFIVNRDANKIEIKQALEAIYKASGTEISVASVRTIKVLGKKRRRGQSTGYEPDRKKAIVTLAKGQILEDYGV